MKDEAQAEIAELQRMAATVMDVLRNEHISPQRAKELDKVCRGLKLRVYALERALSPSHQRWVAGVKQQREAGAAAERGLGPEDIEGLVRRK